jgi:gliding motility-associated-like protein
LQPGRYRATIRDSRGCQFSAEINVIGGQAIVATVNQGQAATCNRSDGSIVISNVSGGSGTFVYSLDGTNFSGTTTFANLAAGAYTVYIREQNGTCVATFPVTVASTACCQLAVTPTATQPTGCSSTDGRIELAVTNGTAPFTYRLNNGAFQNNNVFSGLGNGGYTVTVRDATGCESVVAVSLAAPNALSAQTEQVTPASCFGRADGRVRVFNVTGGSNNIDNYEYSINGGTFQNSALFSGLRAGVYLLTVRDKSNGCVASYPVTVSEAAQIVATVTPTNPTACAVRDGRIAIGNVTGGVGPYEYSLDSLTGYQVTPQFSNLGNGTFRVYVRDSRGCLAVYPIRLGSPNAVNVGTPTLVNPTCQGSNNGEITMGAVTGGQAPYQFNLNGGPYQTSGSFTGLRAGTFTVNVRDQTGCEYPFTYVLTEPATIVFEVRQTKDATCADPTGSVEVTGLLGGTPPYRYSLNGTDFQSSPIFENLEPNDYIMYVRDVSRNTCASSKPFTVRGARSVTFELTTSNIGCSNTERGSIIIHGIRGGIEVGSPIEYDISINGGRTFRSVTTDSVAFTDLEAGLYDIVIGYGANCRTAARRVTINAGSVPFDVTTTPATCGASNGSATATIANPIPGKTYYYSIDSLNFFTTPNFVNLRAGTYRMYLRESINDVCSNIRTFVVAGPDSVRYEIQRDSCNKVVVANLRGGVAPYVVTLEGRENRTSGAIFANEFVLRNLPDGEYTLQVTDAAGCRTRPFNFRVGNRVTFKTKTTPSVIEQPTGGVLIYDIANGQPPYSVSVDGQNWAVVKDRSIPIDTLVTGLPVGLATVWVRDANGCEQKTIVEIEELKFVVPNIFTPNGDGVNDTFFITKLPAGTFVKIVDRWGRVVYETRDYKNEWDGGTYPDGVYYYTIDIAGEKTYRGWVQIWR